MRTPRRAGRGTSRRRELRTQATSVPNKVHISVDREPCGDVIKIV